VDKESEEQLFSRSFRVLDIWHLEQELNKALGAEKQMTVESLKELTLQGEGKEIVKKLGEESSNAEDAEATSKIAEAANYVMSNLDWIENIPEVDGYGSGPVEKTVNIAVARRFKKRGMSWYKGCADLLLKLRLLKLNREWDTYWNERREELARYYT